MQEIRPSARLSRFGVFEVDPRAGELRKNGIKIKLQEQPFQVLAMLLERPGEVVTREELRKKLWPADTFVDFDHGVNTAINKLREALDDSADTPHFVETLPRRGYRFIYPPEVQQEAVLAAPPRRRRVTALLLVAVSGLLVGLLALNVAGLRDRLLGRPLAGEITSLVVLPLENLSGDPEQEYFVDGMTEALITDLGRISALRVISRTSAMAFKGARKPLPEIARQLGVQAVLEGTVARNGDRVRISARLMHASRERILWAKSYERDMRDVLALQAELAGEIAQQIRVAVTPKERARLASTRPVNPDAHQAYLRGRYFWSKRSPEGMKQAVKYFQQAIHIDPTYAPPYAGLADAYQVDAGRFLGGTYEERHAKAKAAVAKALELDDSLAEAHASFAHIRSGEWDSDWAGLQQGYRRAIELNPSYATAHQWLSVELNAMGGRSEEALRHAKRAVELDPISPIVNTNLCGTLFYSGALLEALAQCLTSLQLDDKHWPAHSYITPVYLALGQKEKAAHHEEQALLLSESPEAARQFRKRYQAEGWPGVWRWRARSLEAQLTRGEDGDSLGIAECYVHLGELDNAILALEEGYRRRDMSLWDIGGNPILQPLRADPRFQDLRRRMNLPPD